MGNAGRQRRSLPYRLQSANISVYVASTDPSSSVMKKLSFATVRQGLLLRQYTQYMWNSPMPWLIRRLCKINSGPRSSIPKRTLGVATQLTASKRERPEQVYEGFFALMSAIRAHLETSRVLPWYDFMNRECFAWTCSYMYHLPPPLT